MGEWEKVKLSEVIRTNASSYSAKDNWSYINYLDTGNITNDVISEIQLIDITTDKLPSRARRKVKMNSIVYSSVRPNQCHYGIIKHIPENFLVSTGFIVIDVIPERADPDYIYFLLSQTDIVDKLQAIAEQSVSTYPSIKSSDLENLEVLLPSLSEQQKIASVLCAVSNKITQNSKINDNLVA